MSANGITMETLAANAVAPNATWRSRTIDADGVPIAVYESGSTDQNAPIFFAIHGIAHWTEGAWSAFAARIPESIRLIGCDLPGFGNSGKPDAAYDLATFARALDVVLDTIAPGRQMLLLGHSLGGMIAADLAARRPDRIAQLVLVDPAGFLTMPRWLFAIMRSPLVEAMMTRVRPNAWYVGRQVAQSVLDPASVTPADRARWVTTLADRSVRRTIARVYSGALQAIADPKPLHAHFARFGNPVLLVWGRFDRYIAVEGLEAAQRVYPQAESLVCERSAHCPAIEEPDLFAARVLAFATSRPSDRS